MTYQVRQAIYLPLGDFLELEFHLMDSKAGDGKSASKAV